MMVLVLQGKQQPGIQDGEEQDSFLKRKVLVLAVDTGPILGPQHGKLRKLSSSPPHSSCSCPPGSWKSLDPADHG